MENYNQVHQKDFLQYQHHLRRQEINKTNVVSLDNNANDDDGDKHRIWEREEKTRRYIKERAKQISQLLSKAMEHSSFSD